MPDLLILNTLRNPESRLNDEGDSFFLPDPPKGSVTLKTNGTLNGKQDLLNLVAGSNVTVTDNGQGSVTIAASTGGGGDGGGVSLSDDTPQPLAENGDSGTASTAARADHIHPGTVFSSQVTINTSSLQGMGVDGSGAVQVVAPPGNGIDGIVPIAVGYQYQPGSSPYSGTCTFNLFPNGSPATKFMTDRSQADLGLTALDDHYHFDTGVAFSGNPDLMSGQGLMVGISGSAPLTNGDGSLVVTVFYVYQTVPSHGPF